MTTPSLQTICVVGMFALAACEFTTPSTPQVMVARPLADKAYASLASAAGAGKRGTPEGCFHTEDPDAAYIRGGAPIVIRHRLDAELDVEQQALTAEIVLESVCKPQAIEGVRYATDGNLIMPTLAPSGSECGLIVTLRVGGAETRCEVPANAEECPESATPCAAASEGGSSSGETSGGGLASSGETGDASDATTGTGG